MPTMIEEFVPPFRMRGLHSESGIIPLRFVDPSLKMLNRDVPKVEGLREFWILFEPPGYKPIILWVLTKQDFSEQDKAILRANRPVAAWRIPGGCWIPERYEIEGRIVERTGYIDLDNPRWFQEWTERVRLDQAKLLI